MVVLPIDFAIAIAGKVCRMLLVGKKEKMFVLLCSLLHLIRASGCELHALPCVNIHDINGIPSSYKYTVYNIGYTVAQVYSFSSCGK